MGEGFVTGIVRGFVTGATGAEGVRGGLCDGGSSRGRERGRASITVTV